MVSRKSQILAFIVALAAVFLLSSGGSDSREGETVSKISPVYKIYPKFLLPDLELEAKAVYVFDIKNNRVLYAKNENAQLPLASLAKLMTALVAVLNIQNNETVTITPLSIKEEGDSKFSVGEKWPLENLIKLTLVSSSNDGAAAIAEAFNSFTTGDESSARGDFIDSMNQTARNLGLKQTYFLNETGLDIDENLSGAYGSAKDVSILMIHLFSKNPDIIETTAYENVVMNSFEKEYSIKNTNRAVNEIPGLVSSKTGYTDLAGGNLAVIFEAGPKRPIIAVVLGSTEDGRFSDMKKIIFATLRSMR